MREIKRVGIIGLGALGTLYAHLLTEALGREHVLILADSTRVDRYRRSTLYFNGQPCNFQYADAAAVTEPVDLLLFAVKFSGLDDAIATCRHLVSPETTLLSVLNGISSEQVLGDAFSQNQVVWCVVQKIFAQRKDNRAIAGPFGELALGIPAGQDDAHFRRLTAFFDAIGLSYSIPTDIQIHMWGKLLCNTGCNQVTMVFQCDYSRLQSPGEAREMMLGAMREVVAVANAEGIPLSEKDVQFWTDVIDSLPPNGEPSMRQDGKAHRKSEVELFSGTIRRLARKHDIPVPINDFLYQRVHEMEASY